MVGRIVSVADVFDALTSPRDYPKYDNDEVMTHEPMPLERAVKILENERDKQFDSDVVDAFMGVLPEALERFRGTHFPLSYINAYSSPA